MIQAVAAVLDFAPSHWTSGTRLVAIAIADRINNDWEAWPSIADLCKRTGLGERAVQRAVRQLEEEGVIRRHGQRRNSCGQPVSNLWTWTVRLQVGVSPRPRGGVTPATPPPLTGGVSPRPPKPSSLNHKREPSP